MATGWAFSIGDQIRKDKKRCNTVLFKSGTVIKARQDQNIKTYRSQYVLSTSSFVCFTGYKLAILSEYMT